MIGPLPRTSIRDALGLAAIAAALVLTACPVEEEATGHSDQGVPDAPRAEPNGFGDYCTFQAHPCGADLFCAKEGVQQVGFCTKICPVHGELCEGAPAGSLATCIMTLTTQGSYACAFLCGRYGGEDYLCPTALICSEVDAVGEGLYRCLP